MTVSGNKYYASAPKGYYRFFTKGVHYSRGVAEHGALSFELQGMVSITQDTCRCWKELRLFLG